MFKHQVTYTDFNNKPHTEELYFHVMVPEWADLEVNPTFEGGMHDYIRHAMLSGDGSKVYTFFKMLVANSYGRRSADGSEFEKKPEWTEKFLNSLAWEQFFLWLTDDADGHKNATAFWEGIFPEAWKEKAEALEGLQDELGEKRKLQDLSKEELVELYTKKMAANKVIEG